MTIVLTNDDGVDAAGLWALRQAVKQALATEGVIVAPQVCYSGCGHQVTTERPIQIEKRAEDIHAIAGSPADCTRVAIAHLYDQVKLVLAGINHGGNLGADVYLSGTVAAVREAALHGIPAIAFSHYRIKGKEFDWDWAADTTARVLTHLLTLDLPTGSFWNVNLPHLASHAPAPDLVFCERSRQPLPIAFRLDGDALTYAGRYDRRDRTQGSDVDVCFSGNVAITKIDV